MKDNVIISPINTEKAVRLLEEEKVISFVVSINANKREIAENFKRFYNISPISINTLIRDNKKVAFIKLPKDVNVVSLASEIGMQI